MAIGAVKSLCVCGSGQMGTGIALIASFLGKCTVNIYDISPQRLQSSIKSIERNAEKQIKIGKCTPEEAKSATERIFTTQDLNEAARDVDFVIEAATESPNVKESIFSQLPGISRPETIFASNTSSIPITLLGSFTKVASHRVIGLHFFNPVTSIKGAEIISGLETSQQVFDATWKFALDLDRIPCRSKDSAGFLANRMLIQMLREGIKLLEKGIGDRDSIDNIMKYGCNMPMGPLTLSDFIGLDVCLSIMKQCDIKPPQLLVRMVQAGWLGKKSGKGFYVYK